MTFSPRLSILAAAAVGMLASGAASAAKWDMPLAYPASNFHSQNAAEFAACVGKSTDGKLEIAAHPGGSLFKGNEIKRAVQTGQAQIGERLLSAHQNENALFGIDSQPFLATSFDEAEKLWKTALPAMRKLLDSQNLVYLYSVPWPPQGLYVKKAVESAADLKGIKFRAYNATTAKMAELTGMVPTQVEAAEVTQAFATGVVDSMITSGATGVDSKIWEHVSHFYTVDAWLPRNTVVANKAAWNGLDEATRKAVMGCADKAASEGLAKARAYTDMTLEQLSKNGMTVSPPNDKLRAELQEVGRKMIDEWLKGAGPEAKQIVEEFRGN